MVKLEKPDINRSLNPALTIASIERLSNRINERFPDCGLYRVCRSLLSVAEESKAKAQWIGEPNYLLRFIVIAVILFSLFGLVMSIMAMDLTLKKITVAELVQVSEAAINNIVLIGAAMFFLVSMETRLKRSRALLALHDLRSVAHVIDMHQLTKDPDSAQVRKFATKSSPKRTMSSFELTRYLDYCSEMLALTGKIAAFYAQGFRDPVVLGAVNEIEELTSSLSRKVWQKIIILNRIQDEQMLQQPHQST